MWAKFADKEMETVAQAKSHWDLSEPVIKITRTTTITTKTNRYNIDVLQLNALSCTAVTTTASTPTKPCGLSLLTNTTLTQLFSS